MSARPGGLLLVERAIKRQTMGANQFEWIIGAPTKPNNLTIPFIWVQDPPKPKGLYWQLYRQYNACVRQSKGELIVSWQDYTYTNPDTLERFWFHHTNEPKTLVGAVGNKYQDDTWKVKTWQDPRERDDNGSFYEVFPQDLEYNLCSLPREAIYAVGGWDESLDAYSSVCGMDISMRLEILGGYLFKLDQSIKSYSTEHGRLPNWEENEPFKGPWQKRLDYYKEHPTLKYLTTAK